MILIINAPRILENAPDRLKIMPRALKCLIMACNSSHNRNLSDYFYLFDITPLSKNDRASMALKSPFLLYGLHNRTISDYFMRLDVLSLSRESPRLMIIKSPLKLILFDRIDRIFNMYLITQNDTQKKSPE